MVEEECECMRKGRNGVFIVVTGFCAADGWQLISPMMSQLAGYCR